MSDEEKDKRKKALKILLDYSSDDEMPLQDAQNSFRTRGQELIFGNNSFVSFVRGMNSYDDSKNASNYEDTMVARNHSTPIGNFKNKERQFSEVQSLDNNIADSEFFDAEAGKRLLLEDEVSKNLFLQRPNCTGCSSWSFHSRRNTSSIAFECSKFKQKKTVSVGEFIGAFSETVSFSNNQDKTNVFSNCPTSTPIEKRKSISMSSLLDINHRELNIPSITFDRSENESLSIATPTSIKPLKFSTPKFSTSEKGSCLDFPYYYIGSTSRKNIQRLKTEERNRQYLDVTSLHSLQENESSKRQSNSSSATGSDTVTYALTYCSASNSCYERWYVEPQSVELDSNKGSRVRLVNNSSDSLKFKSTFDARMTNICPLSGTVPAKDEIGLRITISQFAKKQNKSFECDIKIVVGKNEKIIHVTFIKEERSKCYAKRTFIAF